MNKLGRDTLSCKCRDGKGIFGAWGLMGGNRGALEELQDVQARAAGGDPYAMLYFADRLVHGDMLPQNPAQVRLSTVVQI